METHFSPFNLPLSKLTSHIPTVFIIQSPPPLPPPPPPTTTIKMQIPSTHTTSPKGSNSSFHSSPAWRRVVRCGQSPNRDGRILNKHSQLLQSMLNGYPSPQLHLYPSPQWNQNLKQWKACVQQLSECSFPKTQKISSPSLIPELLSLHFLTQHQAHLWLHPAAELLVSLTEF